MELSNNLKILRKENGLTQKKLSEILKIQSQTYNKYETTSTIPDLQTLIDLANYYDVSLDYLVGRNFNNEFGYLTELERNILTAVRKMTDENKQVYYQESKGILLAQNVKI